MERRYFKRVLPAAGKEMDSGIRVSPDFLVMMYLRSISLTSSCSTKKKAKPNGYHRPQKKGTQIQTFVSSHAKNNKSQRSEIF